MKPFNRSSCREASSTADCKDVRQDPWPTLMYTHTQRRVQSSRAVRLGALAIADGCDSRRDNAQATDPKIYIIHVCPTIYYTVTLIVDCFNRSNAEATLARLWAKVFSGYFMKLDTEKWWLKIWHKNDR